MTAMLVEDCLAPLPLRWDNPEHPPCAGSQNSQGMGLVAQVALITGTLAGCSLSCSHFPSPALVVSQNLLADEHYIQILISESALGNPNSDRLQVAGMT
jgi:hypothetical protein